jgi:hypothetical protein
MLPDKYLAEDEMNPGGLSTAMVSARGLNGAHAWSGTSGGEGGHMIIRMGRLRTTGDTRTARSNLSPATSS